MLLSRSSVLRAQSQMSQAFGFDHYVVRMLEDIQEKPLHVTDTIVALLRRILAELLVCVLHRPPRDTTHLSVVVHNLEFWSFALTTRERRTSTMTPDTGYVCGVTT